MTSNAGVTVSDFLPIPDSTARQVPEQNAETTPALGDEATASHALAVAEHEEKGAAQEDHDKEVIDLGWNEHSDQIPKPLVGGLGNEELWMLVRRFDKVRDVQAVCQIRVL